MFGTASDIGHGIGVRLRPSGIGRFFGSAFLVVWLCGWAVGEVFAVSIVVWGALSILRGETEETGPALGMGAFLLVWLTFWTIGGIAAIRELLRGLWAEDRVLVEPPGLRVHRRLGPFRSTVEVRRDEIRRIHVLGGTKALVADTSAGTVELSSLGTVPEREQAARSLTSWLGIPTFEDAHAPTVLPEGWCEVLDPEGGLVVVRDPAVRAKQARFATGLAVVFCGLALLVAREALAEPGRLALAAVVTALAAGIGYGALWLSRGRDEWRIESGRIRLRRRFGARVRDRFEATSLELRVTKDSDGDAWYRLEAAAPGAEPFVLPGKRDRGRRLVVQAIHDPDVPRRVGRWLAQRAGIRLDDRTTAEAQAVDLAELRRTLRESGRLGRVVDGWLERIERRRKESSAEPG